MFKTRFRRFQIAGGRRWVVYGRTTSRTTSRGDLRLVVARPGETIGRATCRTTSRLVVRPVANGHDQLHDLTKKRKALNQASVSVFFQLPDRAVLNKCRTRKASEGRVGYLQMQKKWLPKASECRCRYPSGSS